MSRAEDDDRTMLAPTTPSRPAEPVPTPAPGPASHALPVGTRLAEFEITGVLGAGGFGIVYLAHDGRLERDVALKEYMPSGFALRDADGRVRPYDSAAEAFEIGLHSFVNEARLLARFDAPSLVKVYRFWEDQGTAYMVMPYYRGKTLKQALAASRDLAGEAALRRLLDSVLDALAILHAQQCYHRDIAPDNIMMVDDERPVLLDFGAARRAIGDMPQAFTTIFKQAYAPIEQISESENQRQGPWTDLFALAAVAHYLIDGQPPPPSVARMLSDPYVPLAQRYAGRYSPSLLDAIDRALAVRPQDRPQSVQAMRALMQPPSAGADGGAATPAGAPAHAHATVQAATTMQAAAMPAPAPTPAGKPRWPVFAGGALALVAIGGLALHFLAPQADHAMPAPAAAPRIASIAPTPASGAPAASTPSAPVPAPAAAAAPVDSQQLMAAVVSGADPDVGIQAAASKPDFVIDHDRLGFVIQPQRTGYVYLLMLQGDGSPPVLIFPNAVEKHNRIEAGHALRLPQPGFHLDAAGPAGTDHFVAIVSERPREFKSVGLVPGDPVSTFSMQGLRAAQLPAGLASPLAGIAVCDQGAACPQRYGAAGFTAREVTQ